MKAAWSLCVVLRAFLLGSAEVVREALFISTDADPIGLLQTLKAFITQMSEHSR